MSSKNGISKKIATIAVAVVVLVISLVVLLVNFWPQQNSDAQLYLIPLSVGEKTYTVSVLTNYSSAPEVSYWEEGKAVYVVFRGDQENSFFNVTVPTDLIWGNITLINKYYEVPQDHFTHSYNGTHNSVYFTFDQPAYTKHFEIRGTEGASTKQAS